MSYIPALYGTIDNNNSTTATLTANSTFTGTGTDVLNYSGISIYIATDQNSFANGVSIQFSNDNTNWDIKNQYTLVNGSPGTTNGFSYEAGIEGRYFRLVYTNGTVNQDSFRVQTILNGQAPQALSILKGNITTAPNDAYLDAFSRMRIANPFVIFDSKQIGGSTWTNVPTGVNQLVWDDYSSGTGTSSVYSPNTASVVMSVSDNQTSVRQRQTKQYFNYQPGRGQTCFITGVIGVAPSNVVTELGYFDDNNGLFFRNSGGTMSVVRRTFVKGVAVDNVINQADWNVNPMNGTGPSRFNLNWNNTQIFIIDFQWLGVGRIRFGFDVNGLIYWCHYIYNANVLTEVYMSNPNLPIRYKITSTTPNSAFSMKHICSCVISEGGNNYTGLSRGIDRTYGGTLSVFTATSANTLYPLIAIQLQPKNRMATITINDSQILCSSGSVIYYWALMLNPNIVGTAIAYTNMPNSALQYSISATSATTLTLASGTIICSGWAGQGTANISTVISSIGQIRLGATYTGVLDTLILAVAATTANETFYGSINFNEQI